MKEFLVIRQQASEGCDYTIGCGVTFNMVSAKSMEDARKQIVGFDEKELEKEIEEHIEEYGENWEYYLSDYTNDNIPLNNGEDALSSCWLIEIKSSEELFGDLEANEEKLEKVLSKYRDDYKEIKERQELERLKTKYEE